MVWLEWNNLEWFSTKLNPKSNKYLTTVTNLISNYQENLNRLFIKVPQLTAFQLIVSLSRKRNLNQSRNTLKFKYDVKNQDFNYNLLRS